jgi:hypothetical protein
MPPNGTAVNKVVLFKAPVPQKYSFPEIVTLKGGVTLTEAVVLFSHPNWEVTIPVNIDVWELVVILFKTPLIVLLVPLISPVIFEVLFLFHANDVVPGTDLASLMSILILSPLQIFKDGGVIVA